MSEQNYLSETDIKTTASEKYKQNIFSATLSKLSALIKPIEITKEETASETQFREKPQPDDCLERDEYIHVTNWVEPSIYFTIFCPYKRD